jgi:predicted phosphodiesterase
MSVDNPASGSATSPGRYAHPFFTNVPPSERGADFSEFGPRMKDWVQQSLGPIPSPRAATSVLELGDVIGADAIGQMQASGQMRFHAVGDTGRPRGADSSQDAVAEQMASDYSVTSPSRNPAFFMHLGDVVYGPNKDQMYRDEFYRPYLNYPGKILALAGNHDGEVFDGTDPEPLRAFLENFCSVVAAVPAIAAQVRVLRETMIQPGVYYRLKAPFIDIIALYTNIAEGPGSLVGANGDQSQKQWLTRTLTTIAQERAVAGRRALVLATHHPPYSNAGHSGSPDMLADIDEALTSAGIKADAVISGHAHNYQRHTRLADGTPFVVAGCGGNSRQAQQKAGPPATDHQLERFYEAYGYLTITVSAELLTIDFQSVSVDPVLTDTVTVSLGQ